MKKIICDMCGSDDGKAGTDQNGKVWSVHIRELKLTQQRAGPLVPCFKIDMCVGCMVRIARAYLELLKIQNFHLVDATKHGKFDLGRINFGYGIDELAESIEDLSMYDTGFTRFVGLLTRKG